MDGSLREAIRELQVGRNHLGLRIRETGIEGTPVGDAYRDAILLLAGAQNSLRVLMHPPGAEPGGVRISEETA